MGKTGKRAVGAAFAGIAFALIAGAAYCFLRPPVVIVSDESFNALYGARRAMRRQIQTSLALGRWVKQILIADNAGPDVLVFAVEGAVPRPYCVIFPNRYTEGAVRYSGRFPEIPVILLTGRAAGRAKPPAAGAVSQEDGTGLFFEFQDSLELDFYRAGLCAAVLSGEDSSARIPLFLDRQPRPAARDSFTRALRESGIKQQPLFFTPYSRPYSGEAYPAAVVAGSGAGFIEKNSGVPVVFFTWLDPALTGRETTVIFDDSPWAQAAGAVRLMRENQKTGEIPARIMIISERIADNRIVTGLRKAVRADPQKSDVPASNDLTKN